MKYIISLLMIVAAIAWFAGCKPDTAVPDQGGKPKAAFTVTPVAGKTNTYVLTASTSGAFIWRWDIGDGSKPVNGSQTDTAYYGSKGTYKVQLVVVTKGGYDSLSQTIQVDSDDPNGCFGNKALLTGCASKTWVLAPEAGALWVGPNDHSQTWWANAAGDVAGRACQFNDEYTFSKNGTFAFDNKGDMFVDNDSGIDPFPSDILNNSGNKSGCYAWADINPAYAAWGSGNHTFTVTGSTLTVVGKGAFLGLYKAGDAGTTAVPDNQVVYSIVSLTDTRMVLQKQYSWGGWQFTFVVKN